MKVNNKEFNYYAYIDRNIYTSEMYWWLINHYGLPYGPSSEIYIRQLKKEYIPLNPDSKWIFGNSYVTSKKFRDMSLLKLCFQRAEDFTLFSLTWPIIAVNED